MMFLFFALVLVLDTTVHVFAGQFPVVDNVIGGVRKSSGKVFGSSRLATLATTPGALRVTENSGVCETTPGVYQASGYGDLTATQSVWFWFFAARNNSDTAPLALWFNGGPGSSSMIGLFQELGPCRITNDSSTVTLNPTAWNNNANVLFIDQPVGAGFSHGDELVGTSQDAAVDVWKFLQIWLNDTRFSKFQGRKLAIWTESYGGHYGPTFASYFLDQNAAIASGTITGLPLNLQVLGIGNGLTDPITQYPGYISYAGSNPYHSLVSSSTISKAVAAYNGTTNGCESAIVACNNGGSDSVCSQAQFVCNRDILSPLVGEWDVYYVPTATPDPYPPSFSDWLDSVKTQIGADVTWQESSDKVYNNFAETGDWIRSAKPLLEKVINAGVRTALYVGDADYICNYQGVEAMVDSLSTNFSTAYNAKSFTNYTVAGQVAGLTKDSGTFSYTRIYGAGHEVPAYSHGKLAIGQAALQHFEQTTLADNVDIVNNTVAPNNSNNNNKGNTTAEKTGNGSSKGSAGNLAYALVVSYMFFKI